MSKPPLPPSPVPSSAFGKKEMLALALSLVITIGIFWFRESLGDLAAWGYAGVFLVALLGNATLILPMPTLIFVFVAGDALPGPAIVGLLAGAGAALGELTGYLAGYSGNKIVAQAPAYQKIEAKVAHYGLALITFLALIPSPLFDLAGVAAGALKIQWHRFLLATLLGKTLKMLLVAYAGSLSINWVERLLT